MAARLAPLHRGHNTFPSELHLDLAINAIDVAGATRRSPIAGRRIAHVRGITLGGAVDP